MSSFEIHGYEFTGLIREGGSATTLKAFQTSLQRSVIIKVFHTDGSEHSDQQMQAVMANVRKTAGLKHPGLIEVIDVGMADGSNYVIMGFSEGAASLAERLRQISVSSEKEILAVAEQVASAMDYAWKQTGLVHGNLKPDNIIIRQDGLVSVSDLGMARRDFIPDILTGGHVETTVGTPNYMSPEQVRGTPPLDCRTDIYSLGATLYQMATGRMPFYDTPNEHAMYRHLAETIPNPRDINPNISKSLALLIFRMMMKSPDDRHSSWEALVTDVRKIAAGKTLSQSDAGYGASTVKPAEPAVQGSAPSPLRQKPAPAAQPKAARIVRTAEKQVQDQDNEEAEPRKKPLAIRKSENGAQKPRRRSVSPAEKLVSTILWLLVFALWGYVGWSLYKFPPQP